MREIIVDKKFNNKKLSSFVLNAFKELSFNEFNKALRKKDIRINNKRINKDTIVFENDIISIFIIDEILFGRTISVNKIYEDENILVIFKESGISVVSNNPSEETITTLLSKNYEFIKPCHRLDRNTSGLVLFAKNETSLSILLDKFKNHEIEKHYLATVYGIPKKTEDTLFAYLFKDSKKSLVYISDTPKKNYSKIITNYKVVSSNRKDNTSILDINLITGKTHQIRAHLSHIGFPIIGDGKYGKNEINKKFNQKTQALSSYMIKFNFKTDSGILNYLNNKQIKIKD